MSDDTKRLEWIAKDRVFDGIAGIPDDRWDYAMKLAEQRGHDEPTAEDELDGFRALIDAAIALEATA